MSDSDSESKFKGVISAASVLVVDDSGSMRDLVTGMLREIGFSKIHSAVDGAMAWSYLQKYQIDFVVCDWDMPNLTGMELLSKMKGHKQFEDIPFLMVTGSSEPQRVQEAIKGGVSDYIVKPFQPKDLSYRVVKLLRKIKTKA